MKTLILNLLKDNLFKNSLYPIISTGIMAGLGFVFWIIVAHNFPTSDVGVASALISVMSVIGLLGLFGFDTSIIHFLSNSENKNENINTSIIVTVATSFVFSTFFILLIKIISPKLLFLQDNAYASALFILFCIFTTLNLLTDAIFLSFRSTLYTLIVNTIFSFIKIFLPLAFISYGAFGIFTAAGASQGIGVLISIYILIKKFNYKPSLVLSKDVIKKVWKYSIGNYTADAFNFLPVSILPILIINRLGSEQSAYYSIVIMIVGLLYVIPNSITRSLFAEGSHDKNSIRKNAKKATKHILYMLLPAIAVLLLTGNLLLTIFGHEYSSGGLTFLYIMSFVSLLVGIYAMYGALFRLKHNIKALIVRNITYSVSLILLTYMFIQYGIIGIGFSYAIAYAFAIFISFLMCDMLKK